jgi:hypothetical protein
MSDKAGAHGRTLKLFLVDGTPTGVITAELGNWSGKAVVAPRTALPDLIKRPESSRTGVYLLLGADPDTASGTLIYVGEGDNVKNRLVSHDTDDNKQFFTHVCLIVSKDENLMKSHVRYLESRLLALIRSAARAKLVNGTGPEAKGLPESEIADMEGFLAAIEILLPVLGFDVLRPTGSASSHQSNGSAEPVFVFTQVGTSARARVVGGEFVVLAGSLARVAEAPSLDESSKNKRRDLINDGALVPDQDIKFLRSTRDIPFGSPSGAGSVVSGSIIAGPLYWKVEETGETYKDWRARQLSDAQQDATA